MPATLFDIQKKYGNDVFPPYKGVEPFMENKNGIGYQGVVLYNQIEDKVQCNECVKWFKSVGSHVFMKHGMTSKQYKKKYGLLIKTAICSPTVSRKLSAAAKVNSLISKGEIELEPTLAQIDKASCNWCDKCTAVCPYNAITKEEHNGKMVAVINEANCKGCGICLPVCPSNSIQLIGYTDVEIESMIEALIN